MGQEDLQSESQEHSRQDLAASLCFPIRFIAEAVCGKQNPFATVASRRLERRRRQTEA